jgi:hypothetical protein
MKDDEGIFVMRFNAETVEETYLDGEMLHSSGTSWNDRDTSFKNPGEGFASATDALKAVCEANGYDWNPESWISVDDSGIYTGYFMVRYDNSEASKEDISEWREGNARLWACYIHVVLQVRTNRPLTEEEAKIK